VSSRPDLTARNRPSGSGWPAKSVTSHRPPNWSRVRALTHSFC